MDNVFFKEFLLISDIKTILFLLIFGVLFYIIHILYHKKKMEFSLVVMVGTGFGLFLGLAMQIVAQFPNVPMDVTFIKETTTWFNLFGNGYMNLIKMIVVPLVMVSIVQVIINTQMGKSMGLLVKRTVFVTMGMVALSSLTGILVGLALNLGSGVVFEEGSAQAKEILPVADTLQNLIPTNIVSAMVSGNIIGLVIFSAFFGLAVWWINHDDPDLAKPIYTNINLLHKAMINMSLLILDYMPWAVVALLANTIAQRGISSILDVGKFILAIYIASAVQLVIQLALLLFNGLNPLIYLKKSYANLIMAFTTRSSMGCLPMTIETLNKKLGVNQGTASFVASFGTTAGMQGCAGLFPALLLVYVCRMTGTPIDITMIIMTIIVTTIGSLGIAGIPGTSTMAASVSLSGVGMIQHFSAISPIIAVDPIVDMPRTLLNVTGAMTNALVVDKLMGNLDKDLYNDISKNFND